MNEAIKAEIIMRRIGTYILLTMAILPWLSLSTASAQDSSRGGYRVHGGIGYSTFGWALGVGGSYEIDDNLFSARYLYTEEFELFTPIPRQSIWEVGVLYGPTMRSRTSFLSIAGGVSLVSSTTRGKYLRNTNEFFLRRIHESVSRSTIGLPIEVQAFWTPSSFVAFGIYVFGNMNTQRSFGGALFCFQMGRWRREQDDNAAPHNGGTQQGELRCNSH